MWNPRRVRCADQIERQSAQPGSRQRAPRGPHSGPSRRRPRRGILLLVCLSMLALFSVSIITYVIAARLYMRGSGIISKTEQFGNPPQQIAERAVRDVLRGSRDPRSPFRFGSLLEDLYGNDYAYGELAGPWNNAAQPLQATGFQIINLAVQSQAGPPAWLPANTPRNRWQLSSLPSYYDGAVLTFTTGPAAGRSTRILRYNPANGGTPAHLFVQAFDRDAIPSVVTPGDNRPPRFLINGRANNGAGMGYNPNSGLLDYVNQTVNKPQALLPRYTAADTLQYEQFLLNYLNNASGPTGPVSLSLADEGYDAVDHQNMFLAMHVPTPGNPSAAAIHERTPLSGSYVPVPSMHRPDLIRYWALQFSPNGDPKNIPPAIMQRISFRPVNQSPRFLAMNPAFNPQNPSYDPNNPNQYPVYDPTWSRRVDNSNPALPIPAAPPWDVDNDGDGLTDSVWIDMGYPVQTGPDGRTYKPLVAILCTDLDGRLNLNAHGSLAQSEQTYQNATLALPNNPNFARAAGVPTMVTTFGLGFGPADVNLGILFANSNEYRALFQGVPNALAPTSAGVGVYVPGRYGELGINLPPGMNGPQAGVAGVGSLLRTARWGHYPHRRNNVDYCFADFVSDVSSCGSVADLWGTGFVGLDFRGHPLYRGAGGWDYSGVAHWTNPQDFNLTRNNPYQIDLSRPAARASSSLATAGAWSSPLDAPFTIYELERLLRSTDRDAAALPNRIAQLAPTAFYGTGPLQAAARHMVTTDSWDLPSFAIQTLPELAAYLPGKQALTLLDVLYARMRAANPTNFKPGTVPYAIGFYFAPEVLLGQKFNLNRPFGDGVDSNNNGVVDEPIATEVNNDFVPVVNPNQSGGYPYRHNNGQILGPKDNVADNTQKLFARQIYARQLYVLAMMVCDTINGQLPATSVNAAVGSPQSRTARALAQWAVNVVDFYDRDSAMTYFEYDPLPFTDENGDGHPWDVDGRPDPVAGVNSGAVLERSRNEVWGCERPELLITETLATHDRRTRDTKGAGQGYMSPQGPTDKDPHTDQMRRPQGNLLIELYNPQSPSEAPSRDLYIDAGQNGNTDLLNDGPRNNYALNLAAAVPGVNKGVSPVWRLVIPNYRASALTAPTGSLHLLPAEIERVAYFVMKQQSVQDGLPANARRFFLASDPSTVRLLPGHYAVVTPSPTSSAPTNNRIYMGKRRDINVQSTTNYPGHFDILIAPGTVDRVKSTTLGAAVGVAQRKPAVPVQIAPLYLDNAGALASSEQTATRKLRFSISEPTKGYELGPDQERRDDEKFFTSVQDAPFDGYGGNKVNDILFATSNPGQPIDDPLRNRDSQPFRRVHLQRLANPLLPFDPTNPLANPYITVDSMVVDLAVYSSEDDSAHPDDQGKADVKVDVRRRGTLQMVGNPNVWNSISTAPSGGSLAAPVPNQSMGYLNSTYGQPSSAPWPYRGDPTAGGQPTPFPWFPWNNRPFASQMELLLVPRGNPASMLTQHSVRGLANFNPYAGNNNQQAEFTHLLGFFDSAADGTPPVHLYRLLEFTHAPSRFSGTDTILDGQTFANNPVGGEADALHLRPPFNLLSRYREPGRINLNTIFSIETWRALLGAPPVGRSPATDQWVQASWAELVSSRRGYAAGAPSNDPTLFNTANNGGALPSYTSNPFRSYAGGYLGVGVMKPGIESTLLRSTALGNKSPFQSDGNPLLSPRSTTGGQALEAPYRSSLKNPYFRYQGHQRLGSLATTRSNVFAVWLTVGYFEATRDGVPNDPQAYPDGYWLGAELGSDSGQVTRNRAFYIIDRTQMAAFEPGEDHNTEQTILVRRLIE